MIDDEKFEAFLREFQPRPPAPLRMESRPGTFAFRRLLAAAVVILAASASWWLAARRPNRTQSPDVKSPTRSSPVPPAMAEPSSLLEWTRLAQQDPRQLDAVLDAASRKLLPGFQGNASALAPLAKD